MLATTMHASHVVRTRRFALPHRENVLLAWRARLRIKINHRSDGWRKKKHCCACGRYSLRLCLPAPSPFPAPDKPTPICANSHPQFWLSSGLASIGGRMRRSRRRRRRRRPHCQPLRQSVTQKKAREEEREAQCARVECE